MNSHVKPEEAALSGEANLSESGPRVALEATIATEFAEACRWGAKETILLVEDEALVRKAAAEVLQSAGYKVVIAENATQALTAYRHCPEPVDLLLADVVMPGISGHDLAQEFFKLCPDVRILLMSGYVEELAFATLSPFRQECMAKPFSVAILLSRVREALDRSPFDTGASA